MCGLPRSSAGTDGQQHGSHVTKWSCKETVGKLRETALTSQARK